MKNIENILNCFPIQIHKKIQDKLSEENIDNLEEIRIRAEKPIILKFGQAEKIIKYYISSEEIIQILEHICENSIYSYQKQICMRVFNDKRRA